MSLFSVFTLLGGLAFDLCCRRVICNIQIVIERRKFS